MNLRITPEQSATVHEHLARLAAGIPELPADTAVTPALPATATFLRLLTEWTERNAA